MLLLSGRVLPPALEGVATGPGGRAGACSAQAVPPRAGVGRGDSARAVPATLPPAVGTDGR
jgi:hypothetical protein